MWIFSGYCLGKWIDWNLNQIPDNTSCWTAQVQIVGMASASGNISQGSGHPDKYAIAKPHHKCSWQKQILWGQIKTTIALDVSHEPFWWQKQNRSSESCLIISQREKELERKILCPGLSHFRYPRLNTSSNAKNLPTTDLHQCISKIY